MQPATATGSAPTPTTAPAFLASGSDYNPDLHTRIDNMAASRDCTGLQTEFDIADANNDATRNRTGHNNSRLMDG